MTKPERPEVSVVIPTRGRPELLLRAVRSVLDQTMANLECIIVVDGPEAATTAAIATLEDDRVRSFILAVRSGASAARNAGARSSRAKWVAFLDDDDEWFPSKLARQHSAAEASRFRWPIVACQMAWGARRGMVAPRKTPRADESLSDFLFQRRGLLSGDGTILTSSIFASRDLLLRVGFDEHLKQYQDADWLLRAGSIESVGLEVVPEPLGIWHADSDRVRISHGGSWEQSLSWITRSYRAGLVGREAFASFIMTHCAVQAARARAWRGAWVLLREALVSGRVHLTLMVVYLAIWTLSESARRRLGTLLRRAI